MCSIASGYCFFIDVDIVPCNLSQNRPKLSRICLIKVLWKLVEPCRSFLRSFLIKNKSCLRDLLRVA
jgi:hypothetical protein